MVSRIEELEEQVRMLKQKFKQTDADYYVLYGVLMGKGIITQERFQEQTEKMLEEVEKSEQWLKKLWKRMQKHCKLCFTQTTIVFPNSTTSSPNLYLSLTIPSCAMPAAKYTGNVRISSGARPT